MTVVVVEVDGEACADEIKAFNDRFPDAFLPLKHKHLANGWWWLAQDAGRTVGFTGMVPFEPFPHVGYYKRAAVLPEYRGKGLQQWFMEVRDAKARSSTDWTHIVSECDFDNIASANNFIKAGFRLCDPERVWADKALFWIKRITP